MNFPDWTPGSWLEASALLIIAILVWGAYCYYRDKDP